MSYGGHLSYRLVYNNLSNAAHNTMRPLKSKGVHCIKIMVISQKIDKFHKGLVDFYLFTLRYSLNLVGRFLS